MTMWIEHVIITLIVCIGLDVTYSATSGFLGCVGDEPSLTEHCYYAHNDSKSWHDAQVACMKDGRTLATVPNVEAEDLVAKYLVALRINDPYEEPVYVWLGGRESDDSVWKTMEGKTFDPVGYESKLNEKKGNYDFCGGISVAEGRKFVFESKKCSESEANFLCQKSVPQEETLKGSCSINGTSGVLVGVTCYALMQNPTLPAGASSSWFDARSYCHSLGGDIGSVDDNAMSKVEDIISQPMWLWIGLRRNPWVWITKYNKASKKSIETSEMYYSDWMTDQPNNEKQQCLHAGTVQGSDIGWSDMMCDKPTPYICETRKPYKPALAPLAHTAENTSSNIVPIVVGVIVAAIVVIAIIAVSCYLWRKRRAGYEVQP